MWNYLTSPVFPPLYYSCCFTGTSVELSYLACFPHGIIYIVILVRYWSYLTSPVFLHYIIDVVLLVRDWKYLTSPVSQLYYLCCFTGKSLELSYLARFPHCIIDVVLLTSKSVELSYLAGFPIVLFMLFYWYKCGTILPRLFSPLYHLCCFTDQ